MKLLREPRAMMLAAFCIFTYIILLLIIILHSLQDSALHLFPKYIYKYKEILGMYVALADNSFLPSCFSLLLFNKCVLIWMFLVKKLYLCIQK